MAMQLAVIGVGHVGLVTAACFAELGHQVVAVDQDTARIEGLQHGKMPFYEPELEPLVRRHLASQRLRVTTTIAEGVRQAQLIFICVGTPQRPDGSADLAAVEHVVCDIAQHLSDYRLIIEKSTVPVETGHWIERTLQRHVKAGVEFDVASNPEFLREGTAVHDFLYPDRIVLGVSSARAQQLLLQLYAPLKAPIVTTDVKSAELIKHASNAFLAMKISFINAIAQVCERVGADVTDVAEGMGLDPRIGRAFLNAGLGFGGFCFPKDLEAFIRIAEQVGYDFTLLKAVKQINEDQKRHFVRRIESALWVLSGKTIGVLGLAFKAGTDDMRFAPAIDIVRGLCEVGATVRAYDPQALSIANGLFRGLPVTLCNDPYAVAEGADCLAIVTEWPEFKTLDFARLKSLLRQPTIVDGRNLLDPEALRALGFQYVGIGRENPT